MVSRIPLLQNVRVAAPCSESWDDMLSIDGDRVHHCLGCKMNVYNLSAMTQSEAEGLLRRHEDRLCVRYYQRRDGTVMTKNCPVGAHAARLLLIRRSFAAAALFAVSSALLYAAQPRPLMGDIVGKATIDGPAVPAREQPIVAEQPIMGDVAPPAQVQPIMGIRHMSSLEPDVPAVEPTMGEAILSRQQIKQLMKEKSVPRVDVAVGQSNQDKDVPDVPVTETDEKPSQP